MPRWLFAVFCSLLLVMPAAAAAEVISGIAAKVNEEIITTHELAREYNDALKEMEKQSGRLSAAAEKKLRNDVLTTMIDRKLIRDKIRELNIVISEEEVRQAVEEVKKQEHLSQEALVAALITQGMTFDQYKEQMKEKLERLRLISQEVKANISVTEQEVRSYYDSHLTEFSEEGGFKARSIFFNMPVDAPAAEVRQLMGKVMTVLSGIKKKADFAELAKTYSDDPNVSKDGGDLGLLRKGEMLTEIEESMGALKPGEVSELIGTPTGIHVIKLEEKKPPVTKPFDSVKHRIEDYLYRDKSERRFKKWTEGLRQGAAIEVAD